MHTAFSGPHQKDNSIRRMHTILGRVLEWIPSWEEKAGYQGERAIVNLGSIRGGHPWRVSRTPEQTDLFLDVRVPPTIGMAEARRDVQKLVTDLRSEFTGYGLEFETYVSVPGAEIEKGHEMIKTIEGTHKAVTDAAVEYGTVVWCSDASVLTRYDIPTVNYGPSSGPRGADGEKVPIKTMVDMVKIYALTIAEICGVE
jgi:acetylornithine deacetylase/succinyl-diaminopimelate desuccinylase-like protein